MLSKTAFIFAMLAVASPAGAQQFACSNRSAEIRCGAGACEVKTAEFTPMSLSRAGRTLSICAYSGCWEGQIAIRRVQGQTEFLYARVRNGQAASPPPEMSHLSVLFDHRSNTAQMNWAGFSNVMDCGETP
jgi:hypothetical protein